VTTFIQFSLMNLGKNLKSIASHLKTEIRLYQHILQHPRTPRLTKFLLGISIAYALSPIDLIPDFIPVLGYLDDVIVVGVLVTLAIKMVPKEVWEDSEYLPLSKGILRGDLPPVVVPNFKLELGSSGDAPFFGPF
jgi:uncharacterized membrane protein YkvA (DUF1232 family)